MKIDDLFIPKACMNIPYLEYYIRFNDQYSTPTDSDPGHEYVSIYWIASALVERRLSFSKNDVERNHRPRFVSGEKDLESESDSEQPNKVTFSYTVLLFRDE